ncbi:hypothetical protein GCM10018962_24030 [Dactylosporangium matsuzakiense]|uniref:Uncharacterized protein n=1 Tax=Dactylosporangium matsuzakiense TaxID=53360 RepID=A0A9W6KVS5_9ACTN|nr:hypothetical protein GCM10017581_092430 [Dactylosporangium matsuzakiense]
MWVDDGEVAVRFTTGLGGTYAGAERLGAELHQSIALLKTRAGSATPFPRNGNGEEDVTPEDR